MSKIDNPAAPINAPSAPAAGAIVTPRIPVPGARPSAHPTLGGNPGGQIRDLSTGRQMPVPGERR